MTTQPEIALPFFVYGSLRPGHGNAVRCWYGNATAEHDGEAFVAGYEMLSNGAFPYAVATDDPTDITYGAVVRPAPGWHDRTRNLTRYDVVLEALDALEGYPHHYDRVRVFVNTPDGATECWMYTPQWNPLMRHRADVLERVPGGDWTEHLKNRHPSRGWRR